MTEEIKLKELQKGSESALLWFIERYTAYVSTIVFNIIGSFTDVTLIEEVTSDVFYALWCNAETVLPGRVQGYLAAVARNKAKNKCRELCRADPLEDYSIAVNDPNPEEMMLKREMQDFVRHFVLSMPNPEREIFLRFYYYYQTAEQISQQLGMKLSTVKTKLRRGRERLKAVLDKIYT